MATSTRPLSGVGKPGEGGGKPPTNSAQILALLVVAFDREPAEGHKLQVWLPSSITGAVNLNADGSYTSWRSHVKADANAGDRLACVYFADLEGKPL